MANENLAVNLADLANFTPFEGMGSSDLLSHDGFFGGLVEKTIARKSESGNPMLLVSVICTDADNTGKKLLKNVMLGGKDKNGESMIRQFGEFLLGVGLSQDEIRSFAGQGMADQARVIAWIQTNVIATKRPVYFQARARVYENKPSSEIANFVSKTAVDEAVAVQAHRKEHGWKPGVISAGAVAPALASMPQIGSLPTTANGASQAARVQLGSI